VVIAAVAAAVATAGFAPGAAAAPAVNLFSCWTTPLSVVEKGEPTTNPDRQVCKDDQVAASQSADSAGSVKVRATAVAGSTTRTVAKAMVRAASTEAARATTTESAVAKASAGSAKLTVGSTVIDLGTITSQTTISCTYGPGGARYSYSSKSSVSGVKINGKPVAMRNGPMDIKVNGGTLRLNHAKTTAIGVTQHAVVLNTSGADVVIGESAVALSKAPKNPCHP
jgi:hypothetical protein